MDSFETVTDPAGFACAVKIIPADADRPTKSRLQAYNRQAKARAKLQTYTQQQPYVGYTHSHTHSLSLTYGEAHPSKTVHHLFLSTAHCTASFYKRS